MKRILYKSTPPNTKLLCKKLDQKVVEPLPLK